MEDTRPHNGSGQAHDGWSDTLGLSLAARVSTILKRQSPSATCLPVIHQAWKMKPAHVGLEQFEKLVTWAARQVSKGPVAHAWYKLFEQFLEQGIRDRVWETVTTPPVLGPHEKAAVAAAGQNARTEVQQPRAASEPLPTGSPAQSAPVSRAEETAREAPAEPASSPEAEAQPAGWGKGSVRLGPRWTTGRKRSDYYDYAVVTFDTEKK